MQRTAPTRGRAGFTLVEMLVSVAVLILIMTFVSQMMNSTTVSTSLSDKHGDSDNQARLVFDRMAEDFGSMPHRTDVDFIFTKQPDPSQPATSGSSDKMFFYSETPGFYSNSGTSNAPVALVGYSIYSGTSSSWFPNYSLLRLSKGLSWDGLPGSSSPGGMVYLTSPGPGSTPYPASSLPSFFNGPIGTSPSYSGTDLTDYDVLSSDVLRMEFCFQVKDLTNPNSPGTAYSNYPIAHFTNGAGVVNTGTASQYQPSNPNSGDRWYDTVNNRAYICTTGSLSGSAAPGTPVWTPNGMSDVTAVIVAIASLDAKSRKIVPNQIASIAGSLADPTEAQLSGTNLTLMADSWENAVNSTTTSFAANAGIPQSVVAQIRIYQRFFYLNNF